MPRVEDEHADGAARRIRKPPGSVFVGRKRELDELRAALEDVVACRGRLVMLVGEPGIGKTRTAEELAAIARERDAQVLWGPCHEGEGAPAYWPWVEIIRTATRGADARALADLMGPGAADIAQISPEVRTRLQNLPEPEPIDPEKARFRLFDSITAFLKRLGEARPLVLILDDLHWADKPSLLMLQFLARELTDAQILVLGTYRHGEVSRAHPLYEALGELTRAERVLLQGLSEPDVARFLEASTGHAASDAMTSAVYTLTEGNPFFVAETVRLLVSEDRLGHEIRPGSIAIPIGAREVIGRRLDRLSKRTNEALAIASVLGREFSFDVLAEVSGTVVDELAETLDEAASADIAAPQRHPGRFAFTHALIRETLYEELNTARRAQLHRRVGAAIEKIYAGDLEPHVAEIAHHFFEAGRTEDCAATAGEYAVRAAESASARLAFEEAAGHYERALQAFEVAGTLDRETRCDLLLARGDALRASGDFGAAREVFLRAADLGRELGDWRRTARAALGMGGAYDVDWWLVHGRFGVADAPTAALAEEAIRALPEGEELLRAHLMMRRALALYWSDTSEARRSRAREAIAMARSAGDPATVAAALHGMLYATDATPNARERLDFADEMLERAREARDRDLILQAHRWRLFTFLQLGDVRAAEGAAEAHAQVVRELPNQRFYYGLLSIFRGTFAMLEGRFTEAERYIGHVAACGEQFPSTELRTMADVQRVYLYIQLGRFDELKHVSGGLIERASTMPIAQAAAAHLAMMYGLEEEARATFERLAANDFADLPRGDASWLGMLSHLAGLCFAFGDARRAALLYEEYLPWAAMNCVCATTEPVDGPVSLYLGVLATTCGRLDDAARHFEDALRMATAMGARPYVAQTQCAYAQLLLGRDDRSRGLPMLEQALATAEELGMRPLAEKCRALLGGTPSRVEAAQGTFRREGDYWTIRYSTEPFRLKDAKGLGYIATLLRSPGREVACLVLAGGAQTGDAGEVLDERARAEYRRRIAELEAVRVADPAAQREIDALSAQLSSGVGFGGRSRKAASAAERARVNVRNAITSALNTIRKNDEPLWRHLANAIKTGTFCSYAPDRPIGWEL